MKLLFLIFLTFSVNAQMVLQNNAAAVNITSSSIEVIRPYNGRDIALGKNVLQWSTSSNNTAIGNYSMANYNGRYTVAIGDSTLCLSFYGAGAPKLNNTVIGSMAMQELYMGNENTVVGYKAKPNSWASYYNVAIGSQSQAASGSYTSSCNTSIGTHAMFENTSGSDNCAVGFEALFLNQVGSGNVAIGNRAGYNELGNNKLYIENSDSTANLIGGDFSVNRVGINRSMADIMATNFIFQVGGDASKDMAGSWSSHSDSRLKKNIRLIESEKILHELLKLRGITYEWNDNITKTKRPVGTHYGFIAQNIRDVFPNKVKEDANGFLMTAYGDYDPMFVESIRALNDKIEKLEKQNAELKATILDIYVLLNTGNEKQIDTSSK